MDEQITFGQYMNDIGEGPPALLRLGQKIYHVNKANIYEQEVMSVFYIEHSNQNGYRLWGPDGGGGTTNDGEVGTKVFADLAGALEAANRYIESHEVIFGSMIQARGPVTAYHYVRECDKRDMLAFYCDIGDGLYYIKEFMTFEHICDSVENFMEQQEFKNGCDPQPCTHIPKFKNMYRCRSGTKWLYTEAECSYSE